MSCITQVGGSENGSAEIIRFAMPLNVTHCYCNSEEFTALTNVQELFSKKGNNFVLAKLLARGRESNVTFEVARTYFTGACFDSLPSLVALPFCL